MALVLLLLLTWYASGREVFVLAAMAIHVVNMTAPGIFRPAAIVWFGVTHVLGTAVSKVLLSVIFFGVLTPVGLWRRITGNDTLQLKAFKAGRESVMVKRSHTFTSHDIERPY